MHSGSIWFQKPHGIYFLWLGHGQGLQLLGFVQNPSLHLILVLVTYFALLFSFIVVYISQLIPFLSFPIVKFFVIGHDCAHKSFSRNKLVEDIVGTLAFLPLIYPYEPWRFKHDRHHAKTNMSVWFPQSLYLFILC